MHLPRAAMIALLGIIAGCETVAPAGRNPVIPSAASASQLRPGDSLTVAIIGVPDPTTNNVQIDDQGFISLPFIGTVKASDETAAGLTQRIRQAYVAQEDLHVGRHLGQRHGALRLRRRRGARSRAGSSGRPTSRPPRPSRPRGGSRSTPRRTKVGVVRNQVLYELDIKLAQKNPSQDPRLEPGDSVQVSRSAF